MKSLTKQQLKCPTCIGKVYRKVIMRQAETLVGCCNEIDGVATMLYCSKCKQWTLDLRKV